VNYALSSATNGISSSLESWLYHPHGQNSKTAIGSFVIMHRNFNAPWAGVRQLLCLALSAAISGSAFGQTYWDGGTSGLGNSWATASNWNGDALPAPGTDIVFDNRNSTGSLPTAMSVSADATFGTITFDNINGRLPASIVIVTNGTGGTAARTLTIDAGITLASYAGTVTFNAGSNGTLAFALGGNVNFTVGSGAALAVNPVISGSGRISILGGGTVTLSGSNLFTGGVTVGNGAAQPTTTFVMGATNALGATPGSTFDTSLLIDNGYVRVVNGGSITLPATRGITITPNGANLAASAGFTLTVQGIIKETGGPSRLTIGNASFGGGQVTLAASSNVTDGFSDGVTVQNAATLTISASTRLGVLPTAYDSDNVLLNNGTLRVNSTAGAVVLAAVRGVTITPNGATLLSPTSTASLTVSGPILESGGSSRLAIRGGGLVALSGNSSGAGGFSGGIAVVDPGTVLSVATSVALGVAPGTFVPDSFVLNADTTFAYSNTGGTIGATRGWQIGPPTGTGNATINLSRTTPGSTLRIDGAIADQPGGSGGLITSGTGNILTLTAANTYSGGTAINGGTLVVNTPSGNSGTGTGNVAVNAGGTLAGTGFIIPSNLKAVTVASGGTLAPGILGTAGVSAGSGTLTAEAPTSFATGSILQIGITGNNPSHDSSPGSSSLGSAPSFSTNTFLNVAGTLTLNSGMQIAIDGTGWNPAPGQTYSFPVAQGTTITGIAPGIANGIAIDGQFSTAGFTADPGSFLLFVGDGTPDGGSANTAYANFTTPVPEPTALLGFAAVGLGLLRLRKRRSR